MHYVLHTTYYTLYLGLGHARTDERPCFARLVSEAPGLARVGVGAEAEGVVDAWRDVMYRVGWEERRE
jgi:hypothetical protein